MLHPSTVKLALLAVVAGCLVADVTYADDPAAPTPPPPPDPTCDNGLIYEDANGKNCFCDKNGATPDIDCTSGGSDESGDGYQYCLTKYVDATCSCKRTCPKGEYLRASDCSCQRCGTDTYQDQTDFVGNLCKFQNTCGAGQGFEVGVVQNDGATTAGSCYECIAGGSSGQYHEASTHREDCKTQRQCAKGQFFKGSNTERGVCTTCVGFTYQERESTRVETCKLQKTCGPGFRFEEESKGAKTWEGQCLACDPGTYRSESIHRETTCLDQTLCKEGDIFTSNGEKRQKISQDTKKARRTCSPCGDDQFQNQNQHRETLCKPQTECDPGEKINKDSKTTARACSGCDPNTYRTNTNHREMVCAAQPTCGRGQYITSDSKRARRECKTCGTLYYQTVTNHRLLACIPQTKCPKGQKLSTDDKTQEGECRNCGTAEYQSQNNFQGTSCDNCGPLECREGQFLIGECNRAGGDTLQCVDCVAHEYGNTVHAAIRGADKTVPDSNGYPCKACDVVCAVGKYPRYNLDQGTCTAGSTSNHAECVDCTAGKWGLGTRNAKAKFKDNGLNWGRELAWCQVCGEDGDVSKKNSGGNNPYKNVMVTDVNRLVNQDDASSTEYGVEAPNPGWYQDVRGQGACNKCQATAESAFCERGEKTTSLCTATTPRACFDEIPPQLCTTAAPWKEPWAGPLVAWKGPNVDGDCAARSTADLLEFEAVLDPFEIRDTAFYTGRNAGSKTGFDPTTCFDQKSAVDDDLTRSARFTRTSTTNKFIDSASYKADMTILGDHAVDYTCQDYSNNVAAPASRTVRVKDTVPPTLVLCNKDDDDAICGNAMPTDKSCPLQSGSQAAGIWQSWVGGITDPTNDAATQFTFDVSENVRVGPQRQEEAELSYEAQRDRTDLAWIAACDVCDRKAGADGDGLNEIGFGKNGEKKCGSSDPTAATTIALDNQIASPTNRIADWTDVQSFYVGGDRPKTGTAKITYRVKDSSDNVGSIERTVILVDGTAPELFPYAGPTPDQTFNPTPHPYTAPLVLEAKAKGESTTYADYGARIEDAVEAELDQSQMLKVWSGAVRDPVSNQELNETSALAFDLQTVSAEFAWKEGVAGVVDSRVGRYKVEYAAADSAGNVGFAARWVVVQDVTPPEITVEWPALDGVHGPGDNATDMFMLVPDLGEAGWANFGVPWEEPDVTVTDTHLPDAELRSTIEVWTSFKPDSNNGTELRMCCKGWAEECTARANLTQCVDTSVLNAAGLPAIGATYTLIYKMSDYSEDDALLIPVRVPNVAIEKKRTVFISDRLPPVLTVQTGALLGFEDATSTDLTMTIHVGKFTKKKDDVRDGNMDGEQVMHGGFVYLDSALTLEAATAKNPNAQIATIVDCSVPAVANGNVRGNCAKGINYFPSADCLADKGRCEERLIASFEDPGFTFTDNIDTYGVGEQLRSKTTGTLTMKSIPELDAIKAECASSRDDCLANHQSTAYVAGLGEAGLRSVPGSVGTNPDMTADFTAAGTYTIEYAMVDANGNLGSASRTITFVRDDPTRYTFVGFDASTGTWSVELASNVGSIAMIVAVAAVTVVLLVLGSFAAKSQASQLEAAQTATSTTTNPTFSLDNSTASSSAKPTTATPMNAPTLDTSPSAPPPPPPESWYHGAISRKEAEKRIRSAEKKEGVYLVRAKNVAEGEYALSLLAADGRIVHYVVKVPSGPGEQLTVQTKPVNLPWVTSLRDFVIHLQTETSKLVATKLRHTAPIPSNGPSLIVQAAAQPNESSGQTTVESKVYAMVTEDPETFSINETYSGHPTGLYYRMFYPLDKVKPLPVYTRQGEAGGMPDGSSSDVFQLVEYKSKRLGQLPRNAPLYVRIPPEDLGPHIGLDDDAVVIDIAVYEEAVRNQPRIYEDAKKKRAEQAANYEDILDNVDADAYDAMGSDYEDMGSDCEEVEDDGDGDYKPADASEESRLGLDYSSLNNPKTYGSNPQTKGSNGGKAKVKGKGKRKSNGPKGGKQTQRPRSNTVYENTGAPPAGGRSRARANTQFTKAPGVSGKSGVQVSRPRSNTAYENTNSRGGGRNSGVQVPRPRGNTAYENTSGTSGGRGRKTKANAKASGDGIRREERKSSVYLGFGGAGGNSNGEEEEIEI
eukprot:gene3180-28387_t